MFFYFRSDDLSHTGAALHVLEAGDPLVAAVPNTLYVRPERQQLFRFNIEQDCLVVMGDPILPESGIRPESLAAQAGIIDEEILYEEIRGHYYWFFLHANELCAGASFGGIFPIYYHISAQDCSISSSAFFLAGQCGAKRPDHCNLLERLMFHYPLSPSTWWEEIKRLECHRHLRIHAGRTGIEGGFDISRHFGKACGEHAGSLDDLIALFRSEAAMFIPDAPFGISLTGGFDGRALTAVAIDVGKPLETYCFGSPGSSDLVLSQHLANRLHIPFSPILLDERYLKEEALPAARTFMYWSEYNGNLGRPHYAYTARLLSGRYDYILTGNFGSEIFRAMHSPGEMLSKDLIGIIQNKPDQWKTSLKQAVSSWSKGVFDTEVEYLINYLETRMDKMKGLRDNEQWYVFVFEEVMRKYFGPELILQSHFFNNRTPYLNLKFVKALHKTQWAGVHARLFDKNLLRRKKGQEFYAALLRRIHPYLYHAKTNKGYRPADLLEPWRFPILAGGAMLHKHLQSKEKDPHAVFAFFKTYGAEFGEKLLQGDSHPFIEAQIRRSLHVIRNGEDLPHWIQLYSIAMGWQAAGCVAHSKADLPC